MDDKYVRQFKKGALEMILLRLIAREETYGYALLDALNRGGAQVLGYAREGTVYPILYRLEEAGLIRCRIAPAQGGGGTRKYYSITPAGETALRERVAFWREYAACVEGFLAPDDAEGGNPS